MTERLDRAAAKDEEIRALQRETAEKGRESQLLRRRLATEGRRVCSLERAVAEQEQKLRQLQATVDWCSSELEAIHRTRGYRWLNRARAFRDEFVRGTNSSRKNYLRRVAAKLLPIRPPDPEPITEPDPAHPFSVFKRQLSNGLPLQLQEVGHACLKGLVSIVLPVHNQADLVAAGIDSVLAQTYRRLELIIVNDGSTDGLEKVLARYEDPRLRIIHQENQKLPAALSTGFRIAKGEFYTWTSADNILLPDVLAAQVAFLRRHPRVQMVYGNYRIIGADGKPLLNAEHFRDAYQQPPGSDAIHLPRDPSHLNNTLNNYIMCSFMYRGWMGRLLGDYLPGGETVEDYDYWMRINAFFNIRHIAQPDCRYLYRVHDRSLTGQAEELGIVPKAHKLMAVERWRQGFYLQPFRVAIWVPDRSRNTSALADRLAGLLRDAGHEVMRIRGPDEGTWRQRDGDKRLPLDKRLLLAVSCGGRRRASLGLRLGGTDNCVVGVIGGSAALPTAWVEEADFSFCKRGRFAREAGRGNPLPLFVVDRPESALYPMLCAANNRLATQRLSKGWEDVLR